MKLDRAKIMVVGCGSMGASLIKGWLAKRLGNSEYTVITPRCESIDILRETGVLINWFAHVKDLPASYTPDVIVFAVKPKLLEEVLPSYKVFCNDSITLITVAAGKKLNFYHKYLGRNAAIIRMMPNLPVAYGKGISVGMANENVTKLQLSTAHFLFKALGKVVWIDDERLFDPATALSGCGPAYLFLLTECMTKAGQTLGLSKSVAEKLARYSMTGAGALLEQSSESPTILKQRVASTGGVTQEALKVLEDSTDGMAALMTRAIKVAAHRSKELSE